MADLHVYTGSQIQTHQSINGFLGWLNDVNQTQVSTDFVLIARVFVDVRGDQNSEALFACRQRDRTTDLRTSALGSLDDFRGCLIDQTMIKRFQADTDYFGSA